MRIRPFQHTTLAEVANGGCHADAMLRDVMISRTRGAAAFCGLLFGFAACVVFLTLVARHTRFGSSDNANALLAGQAMFRGNPLLRDWELPTNSYWLIDLPVFGLASVLFGVREVLLHAVPAAVAVTAIIVASGVAPMGLRLSRRWWVGAGVVFILLGLPHLYLVLFVLQGPHHLATALFCLIAFALLAGSGLGRPRWVAGTILLAITVHSDAVAIGFGIVPIAGAGLLDAMRTRRLAALAAPLAAAVGATVGALLLGFLLHLAGGFTLRADPPPYVVAWRENLRATPTILGGLLGVLSHGGLAGGALVAHAVGAALFAGGIVLTLLRSLAGLIRPSRPKGPAGSLRSCRPSPAWLDDVLLIGCAGGIAVFALLTRPGHQVLNARYVLPSLLFGAVLTARRTIETTARIPAPALAAAGIALGAAYLTTPLATVRNPVPVNPTVAMVDWLKARNLDRGYGPYWVAGLATVSGRGVVAVRPVIAVEGRLKANTGFASRRWFEGDQPFRFVVLDAARPDGVDEQVAVAAFGVPIQAHDVGPYRVLVWDRNLTVPLDP
jgi:hypothetical protein